MKSRSAGLDQWLPLTHRGGVTGVPPTGEAFQPEWIDFRRGIRVGGLQPHERITQMLKYRLETRYRTPFVIARWGRGAYWQWICWLPRANRDAKPISHDVSFGCAKLFLSVSAAPQLLKAGLQVERGYAAGPEAARPWGLRPDFDWHRLLRQCRAGTVFERELRRLILREGFVAAVLVEDADGELVEERVRAVKPLRAALQRCAPSRWAGFQLYYPLGAGEVRSCSGLELVQAICGVFAEVLPAMNCCMQVPVQLPS